MLDRLADIVGNLGDGLLRWRLRDVGGEWRGAQLKTQADREAHRDLSRALRGLCDLPVVSEEDDSSHRGPRPQSYWLIDPIDGTASLAGGFDGFVLQAALMRDDQPVLAAIRAPALGLLYLAERASGAFCNGSQLRVDPFLDRVVLTDNYPAPRGAALELMKAVPCTGYLESGSISLKICRVADGTADVLVKHVPVRDWDIAAPYLVLTEAQGRIAGIDGTPYCFSGAIEKPGIIAARTPALAEQVTGYLRARTRQEGIVV